MQRLRYNRIMLLPVVLYGCETWLFILWEECRLSLFENRVLSRLFGPKRDKITGELRKLHNEYLSDLFLPNNILVLSVSGLCNVDVA
jgi:hypothetical protein